MISYSESSRECKPPYTRKPNEVLYCVSGLCVWPCYANLWVHIFVITIIKKAGAHLSRLERAKMSKTRFAPERLTIRSMAGMNLQGISRRSRFIDIRYSCRENRVKKSFPFFRDHSIYSRASVQGYFLKTTTCSSRSSTFRVGCPDASC